VAEQIIRTCSFRCLPRKKRRRLCPGINASAPYGALVLNSPSRNKQRGDYAHWQQKFCPVSGIVAAAIFDSAASRIHNSNTCHRGVTVATIEQTGNCVEWDEFTGRTAAI